MLLNDYLFDRQAVIIFGPAGLEGKRLEGLRVKFEIEKTIEKFVNKASISVYNLTRDSQSLCEKKDLTLLLSVGYGALLEDIFKGDVARPITVMEGSDYITTFEVGDGEKAYKESKVNFTFKEGTALKDMFLDVAKTFGKQIKDMADLPADKLLNGFTATGLSRNVLDDITAKSGLEWSIQDGDIQITKRGKTTSEEAVLLSSSTGLIGRPMKKDDSYEFTSLLQPKIKPGRKVQIDTPNLKGIFRCEKVIHKGDNFDKDWFTVMEAKPV
jgi:hypothetical protein